MAGAGRQRQAEGQRTGQRTRAQAAGRRAARRALLAERALSADAPALVSLAEAVAYAASEGYPISARTLAARLRGQGRDPLSHVGRKIGREWRVLRHAWREYLAGVVTSVGAVGTRARAVRS